MPTRRRPSPAEQRAAREARRLQAAELFAQGHSQAEVARQLGVSRQSAHIWHTRLQQGGVDALHSRGPTGPDPKLSAAQLAKIEQALLAGAMANGFDTDLWTLERVAVVITQLTGVRHHPGHVWSILRQRLGWTLQRPERRASERDEQAGGREVGLDDLSLSVQVGVGDGVVSRTRQQARLASWQAASGERSTIGAISSKGTAKMSWSANASRSVGLGISSTTSSARPTESASSASCSGSVPSARSTIGSSTCMPSGCSRRESRERSMFSEMRATRVVSYAPRSRPRSRRCG
jgi:transposase